MSKITKTRDILELIWLGAHGRGKSSADNYLLFEKLIDMGGLYVKFAQLLLLKLSGERQHMAREFSFLLKKAYDSTPFEPIDINGLLRSELGNKTSIFSSVEMAPFAAGSFGQVYKATLNDGSQVIIKALRPSVLRDIHFDLKLLGVIARLVGMGSRDTGYDVISIFSKFKHATFGELNYPREADYAHELYLQYRGHHSLVIPKTYLDLCTRHLIVQEYVDGVSLADVVSQKEMGHDPKQYVKDHTGSDLAYQMIALGQSMLESMLSYGSAHGDPHPGNIKLLPDNKIALIDFGISAKAPTDKKAFFDLIKQYQKLYAGKFDIEGYTWAMVNLFVNDLTTAIRSIDMYSSGRYSQQLFKAISDAATSFYLGSGKEIAELVDNNQLAKIFSSVINENNRFGFNIEIEEPEFMRATLMYIALVGSLEIKNEVLLAVYSNVVNEFQNTEFHEVRGYTNPENAISTIAEWLEKIAAKDIYLYQMLSTKISTKVLNV